MASLLRYGQPSASDFQAPRPPSPFIDWAPILVELGVTPRDAARAGCLASHNATTFQVELVAASIVREDDLYWALARHLGLSFQRHVSARHLTLVGSDAMALLGSAGPVHTLRYVEADGATSILIAPDRFSLEEMKGWVGNDGEAAARLKIVTPSAYRAALATRAQARLIETARDGLFVTMPQMSARLTANGWQGVVLGVLLMGLIVFGLLAPFHLLVAIHVVATIFFFGCVWLRIAALFRPARLPKPPPDAFDAQEAPVYTLLVALYREADVVPELLVSLGRLVWPRAKLQIRLVCEADDHATLGAIRAHALRNSVEIIEVPPGMPRSKPNALAYALPQTSGELVVLYDAEDRPHPGQLIEAWHRFRQAGPDLACLQAPIDIDNGEAGLIPRLFAAEYAALFRGLLPWLAERGLLLPLGGTSNHFRRAALEEVGGWDPYNVTEDADLGARLVRFGYHTGVISCPTGEDAPDGAIVWLRQRTRWLKGWSQTWLVHMRSPRTLLRELGLGSFVMVQIMFLGIIVSALAHPLLLLTGGWLLIRLATDGVIGDASALLLAVDAVNIVLSYTAVLLLAWRCQSNAERRGFWKTALFLPIYWLMISAAAWRALWQLYTDPHRWEKTPHRRRRPPPTSVKAGAVSRRVRLSSGSPVRSR